MKKNLSLLILFVVGLMVFPVGAQEQKEQQEIKSYEIDFNVCLNFSYNRTRVELGQEGLQHTLIYPLVTLEVDVEIFNNLTLGVVAGYNQNYFKEPVDFFLLPLSLRVNEEKNSSMVLGLNVKSEIVSFSDFSLVGKGEFLYFKLFKHERPIDLPIARGRAVLENSFYQLTVDLLLEYHRLSGIFFFLGPRLNLVKGKFSAEEQIEDIEARQTLNFKQKNFLDMAAGVNIELSSSLELILAASFFARTSLAVGISYLF